MNKPRAARAVGNALNKNTFAPQVPCHRAIRSNGEIGGFASGSKNKIRLLKKEGIEMHNNKIDLQKYFYEFKTKR
ncbi:MAG: MGMT family protein [Candidatus Falkowbacteria bacterium]